MDVIVADYLEAMPRGALMAREGLGTGVVPDGSEEVPRRDAAEAEALNRTEATVQPSTGGDSSSRPVEAARADVETVVPGGWDDAPQVHQEEVAVEPPVRPEEEVVMSLVRGGEGRLGPCGRRGPSQHGR